MALRPTAARLLLAATLVLMLGLAAATPAPAQTRDPFEANGLGLGTDALSALAVPPGFTESVAFSGLTEPSALRFAPDGRVVVAEKSGRIKIFDNLADSTPTT